MLYSFLSEVLFCHIPRTGGVSIGAALARSAPDIKAVCPQHAPLIEAQSVLEDDFDAAFKFSVVRNPWDRLVSWNAFLTGIREGEVQSPEALQDPDAPHWREFEALVDLWTGESIEVAGRQVPAFSQFHQLANGEDVLLADKVLRFETLASDVAQGFEAAGLKVPRMPHKNASARLGYQVYYSEAARDLVAERLAQDLKAFGYRFDLEA